MPCYHPIPAYQAPSGGAVELYAAEQKHLYRGRPGKHFHIPCGRCSGCRRKRALQWATRAVHEAQQHEFNSALTLTYDDEHLPADRSLSRRNRDFALLMKKIRNLLGRETRNLLTDETNIPRLRCSYGTSSHPLLPNILETNAIPPRYYMAGEYGSKFGRPHYHAILFGLDWADKTYFTTTNAGSKIYTSELLTHLWGKGFCTIGNVDFATAAYIARYCMKKLTGDGNKYEYEIIDPETGEIYFKLKEYNQMSRNKGIGSNWFDAYKDDVIYQDWVITKKGTRLKPPRYYDKLLKRFDRALYEHTKHMREIEALAQAEHHTPARLAVQETVANANARLQTRNLPELS